MVRAHPPTGGAKEADGSPKFVIAARHEPDLQAGCRNGGPDPDAARGRDLLEDGAVRRGDPERPAGCRRRHADERCRGLRRPRARHAVDREATAVGDHPGGDGRGGHVPADEQDTDPGRGADRPEGRLRVVMGEDRGGRLARDGPSEGTVLRHPEAMAVTTAVEGQGRGRRGGTRCRAGARHRRSRGRRQRIGGSRRARGAEHRQRHKTGDEEGDGGATAAWLDRARARGHGYLWVEAGSVPYAVPRDPWPILPKTATADRATTTAPLLWLRESLGQGVSGPRRVGNGGIDAPVRRRPSGTRSRRCRDRP